MQHYFESEVKGETIITRLDDNGGARIALDLPNGMVRTETLRE